MYQWRLSVFVLLSSILFFIAILKAARAAITWDEAFTYFEFIKSCKFYPGAGGGMAANNHLLNTWISFVFAGIFGANEFALRLGNILFYAAYLAATVWIALRPKGFSISISVFALLNLNPYLFDFFCLSRGYGMAHTCLLFNILFIYSFYQTGNNIWLKWMLSSAIVGMLAGAMLLPAFGLLYAIVFLVIPILIADRSGIRNYLDAVHNSLKRLPAYLHVIYATALLIGAAYLIILQKFNAFLFGGNSGVINDMFLSILKNSKYNSNIPEVSNAVTACILILIFMTASVVYKKRMALFHSAEGKTAIVLILTFVGIILSSGITHSVFLTPLPAERTALYLYLMFAAIICFVLIFEKSPGFLFKMICTGVAILLTTHFISTFNVKTFHDWKSDADAPLMINDLSLIIPKQKNKHIIALASLELELPLKFYLEKNGDLKKKVTINRISYPVIESEIYFLDLKDSGITDSLEKEWLKAQYPQGGTMIYNPVIGQ